MTRSKDTTQHYTPHATLASIGLKIRSLKHFDTVRGHVRIKQKTVRLKPVDKLYDAFIAILAGAHGLREINTRLQSDESLQRAFGRDACAEKSVVQETLNACTAWACSRCGTPATLSFALIAMITSTITN